MQIFGILFSFVYASKNKQTTVQNILRRLKLKNEDCKALQFPVAEEDNKDLSESYSRECDQETVLEIREKKNFEDEERDELDEKNLKVLKLQEDGHHMEKNNQASTTRENNGLANNTQENENNAPPITTQPTSTEEANGLPLLILTVEETPVRSYFCCRRN